ncbi:MAG: tRNA (adenosine(37)-N6)-threonylcarbamoyltransferase complex dimerization subunit type 1 TsaB [Cytophagales bacterium]|nr:MAG: tRNA (adenosine(37)-N6)-threonylcarbamoyltransferase complex dimerization subunit type 1 TsaB [Cytophagales bacterium]
MSYLLSIDTATQVCSVALYEHQTPIAYAENHTPNSHSSVLPLLIQQVLAQGNCSKEQLSAIVISAGPGSYTGLRIGVATAKGLCFSLDIPLIAVNTLEALAQQVMMMQPRKETFYYCPMLDARRMEVYCTVLDAENNIISPTEAKIITQDSFKELFLHHKILFFGNGAAKCKPLWQHEPNAYFLEGVYSQANTIAQIGQQKYANQQWENIAYFEPYYLKDFWVMPKEK